MRVSNEKLYNVVSFPGEQGDIEGKSILTKPKGTTLSQSEIPTIKPKKGYKFMGWSQSTNCILNHDYVFNAQYERILPWYKRPMVMGSQEKVA